MARLFAAAAVVAAQALGEQTTPAGAPDAQMRKDYDSYVQKFGKHYKDGEEDAYFAAFSASYQFIQAENAKKHTYKLGLNALTDLPRDHFIRTRFNQHKASTLNATSGLPWLGEHSRRLQALPDSVDWRQKGAVTDVKDQGNCGACWSFSATGALEGAWKIASGSLRPLSQQQFIDCDYGRESIIGAIVGSSADWGCTGGEPYYAFQYAQTDDLCVEGSYGSPYTGQDPGAKDKAKSTCAARHCSSSSVAIPKGSVTGYRTVSRFSDEALMDAVASQPVSVQIYADADAFHHYASGVLQSSCGWFPLDPLDHAVLVVGYGVDKGLDYWLVKNSWGSTWGEGGYIRMLRGQWGAGECGIKGSPHYPVVKFEGSAMLV